MRRIYTTSILSSTTLRGLCATDPRRLRPRRIQIPEFKSVMHVPQARGRHKRDSVIFVCAAEEFRGVCARSQIGCVDEGGIRCVAGAWLSHGVGSYVGEQGGELGTG